MALGLVGLLVLLIALVILWVVVSIPVYIAAKAITSGRPKKANFGEAMWATLGGAIVYVLVVVIAGFLLGAILGGLGVFIGVLLAIIAWLAVYKSVFSVGWLGALGIAILAAIVLFIMDVILVALFGVALPSFLHPF